VRPKIEMRSRPVHKTLFDVEREPMIALIVSLAMLAVTLFSFDMVIAALVVPPVFFAAGVIKLREYAAYDPQYFRILWRQVWPMRIPRKLLFREVLFNPPFWRQNSN